MKIREWLHSLRAGQRPMPPVISTPYGPVTESMRLQAAMNMRADIVVRFRVEQTVIKEMDGDVQRGIAECKRRYPEAYD